MYFIPVLEEVDDLVLDVLVGGLGHLYLFEVQSLQNEYQLELLLLDLNLLEESVALGEVSLNLVVVLLRLFL